MECLIQVVEMGRVYVLEFDSILTWHKCEAAKEFKFIFLI